jgi:hypothetical protein
MLYTINKCEDTDDFDNGCLRESDGGLYTAKDAVRILENGNGGSMSSKKGNFSVNYDASKNKWLKSKLKI